MIQNLISSVADNHTIPSAATGTTTTWEDRPLGDVLDMLEKLGRDFSASLTLTRRGYPSFTRSAVGNSGNIARLIWARPAFLF